MAKWTVKQIQDYAIEELKKVGPSGVRYAELGNKIHSVAPETPRNTIFGSLQAMSKTDKLFRPSRGLWVHKSYWDKEGNEGPSEPVPEICTGR